MTIVKMLTSMAPNAVINAAAQDYYCETGVHLDVYAAGGIDIARRVAGGELTDVVVLSSDAIDQLITNGLLLSASRLALMSSGIAAAVRSDAKPPYFENASAVRQTVLNAESISYSTGPSGRYLEGLFARWHILEQIRARIVVPPPGVAVANLIASGKVALGFQQMSELIDAPGIRMLGALPDSIQHITIFVGAVTAVSSIATASADTLAYLASTRVEHHKKRHGMASVGH